MGGAICRAAVISEKLLGTHYTACQKPKTAGFIVGILFFTSSCQSEGTLRRCLNQLTDCSVALQNRLVLVVLVVVFGICWAPFHTDRLTWSFIEHWTGDKHLVFQYVHILSGVFFYLSSAVNPILYNLMSTRFREMFNDVMCQGSHRQNGRKYSLSVTRVTTRSVVCEPPPGHGPALSDVEDYELYLECNNENETSFT
ncbi:UNVERIFIED_CONTAM: hypothetical protein FKN15_023244 [Acipenser sinensis]